MLTETGKQILREMRKKYGRKRGEQIFYATMRKRDMQDEQEESDDAKQEPVYHKKLKPIPIKNKKD